MPNIISFYFKDSREKKMKKKFAVVIVFINRASLPGLRMNIYRKRNLGKKHTLHFKIIFLFTPFRLFFNQVVFSGNKLYLIGRIVDNEIEKRNYISCSMKYCQSVYGRKPQMNRVIFNLTSFSF